MDDDKEIQEFITHHLKDPKFVGTLISPTQSFTFQNPFCNDEVTYDIKLKDELITDIRFRATGCVLSRAAADIICELLHGKIITEVLSYSPDTVLSQFGDIISIRKKCATFGLEGLLKDLSKTKK